MTACEKCVLEFDKNVGGDICDRCIKDSISELQTSSKVLTQAIKYREEVLDVIYNQIER